MIRALAAIATVALLTFTGAASADNYGTKDEAVAMVKRVQAMFAKDGADATFKAVSDKAVAEFHDRDLYPFIYDMQGNCVAHGARGALIGKNLMDLKDQDGKYLIHEMIDVAKGPGSGWIDYKWPNPLSNKIEDKSSYVEKMGDYFVGVGVYRD
jgi:cytochrome c